MGSFNVNCFLTKQVINPNDSVVLFPIQMQVESYRMTTGTALVSNIFGDENTTITKQLHLSNIDGTSELMGIWSLAAPMLTAKYDDYGCFKIDNTKSNVLALQTFFKYINSVFLIEESAYNNTIVNFNEWVSTYGLDSYESLTKIWDNLYDAIMNDVAFTCTHNDVYKLGISVISQHTFDYLLNKSYSSINHKEYFYQMTEKRLSTINFNYDRTNNDDTMYHRHACWELLNLGFLHLRYYEIVGACYRSYKFKNNFYKSDIINDKEKFTDLLYTLLEDAYKCCYVLSNMFYLSVRFEPIMTTGQDYKNRQGNDYADLVNYVNRKVNESISLITDE